MRFLSPRIIGTFVLLLATAPLSAEAQTLLNTLALVSTLLNASMSLLVTCAIIAFFYGLVRYIFSSGQESSGQAVRIMFWGVIVIFVMVSIWGFVGLLQNTFKVGSTEPIVPQPIQINLKGAF